MLERISPAISDSVPNSAEDALLHPSSSTSTSTQQNSLITASAPQSLFSDQQILQLRRDLSTKDDEIQFLRNTNQGLIAESDELAAENGRLVQSNQELENECGDLKKRLEKQKVQHEIEVRRLTTKLESVQSKMVEVNALKENLTEPSSKKAYSELKPTQRAAVHKQVSETFGPAINRYVRKRKLSASYLVLDDDEGAIKRVRINFKQHRTYEQLSPSERERVGIMSDLKYIHRTSNESYLSHRSNSTTVGLACSQL